MPLGDGSPWVCQHVTPMAELGSTWITSQDDTPDRFRSSYSVIVHHCDVQLYFLDAWILNQVKWFCILVKWIGVIARRFSNTIQNCIRESQLSEDNIYHWNNLCIYISIKVKNLQIFIIDKKKIYVIDLKQEINLQSKKV